MKQQQPKPTPILDDGFDGFETPVTAKVKGGTHVG